MSFYFRLYSHENKLLFDHLKNVSNLSKKFFENIKLNIDNKKILAEVSYLIGITHDFAKATTFFQKKLFDKEYKKEKSDHSYLSSIFSYWLIKKYLEKKQLKEFEEYIPYFAWLIIVKHHGNLEDWEIIFDKLKKSDYILEQIKDIFKNSLEEIQKIYDILLKTLKFKIDVKEFLGNYEEILNSLEDGLVELYEFLEPYRDFQNLEKYFEFLLLYSCLIDADKLEASCDTNREFDEFVRKFILSRKDIAADIVEKYKYKNLKVLRPIDEIRERAYEEVVGNIEDIDLINKKIFSIELPTGAGKTLTALSFALKLRKKIEEKTKIKPRIIYSLPFLSIIDQNSEVLNKVLGDPNSSVFLKHHHLAEIRYEYENKKNNELKEFEKDKALLLINGWYSEIIITTFVQLFESIISNRNNALRKVHNIPNSIIILDEFQSIPIEYWGLTREILKFLSEKWNCYIILMTATIPMILEEKDVFSLIKDPKKYFTEKNFNRVNLIINKEVEELEEFENEIYNKILNSSESILVVLNTIKSSQILYKSLKKKLSKRLGHPKILYNGVIEFENFYLINLNANTIPYHRLERIKLIRNSNKRKIIISTQLIEAGVDIDIDIVYRDLAPIDSIIQTAGRCNRNSSRKKGKVYIVILKNKKNLLYSKMIYGLTLIDAAWNLLKETKEIEEKEVRKIIKKYFEIVRERKYTEGKELRQQIANLQFNKIEKFSLIKEEYGKKDFCICFNNALELTNKIKQLKEEMKNIEYKKKFEILAEIKNLRRLLEKFIISPLIIGKENLIPYRFDENLFLYIVRNPKETKIYDLEIGFNIDLQNKTENRIL